LIAPLGAYILKICSKLLKFTASLISIAAASDISALEVRDSRPALIASAMKSSFLYCANASSRGM
jgi:hypothetical protein